MAILTLISALGLVCSAMAVAVPEEAKLLIAVPPVTAYEGREFPCEDRFAASLLNGLRRAAVSQFKKVLDSKKLNEVDGLILMKTLNERLAHLDSTLYNLTSDYHSACAECVQGLPCCLELRGMWARRIAEAYDTTIDQLCWKVNAAECTEPLKKYNPTGNIAELLRCEAQCKYFAYTKEPICVSDYS